MEDKTGKLYIVPTPIGNLGDMTLRSIEVLKSADQVYAEDTRVTGRLLSALDIKRRADRLDENTLVEKTEFVIEGIAAGQVIAYCSDAGMPGVSDPGLRLVAAVRAANLPVEVLPGPSASITAYVASGCIDTCFYFGGFLPRKQASLRDALLTLKPLDAALIFYESPKRVIQTLHLIDEVFPHREVAICRELTKLHEEVLRASAGNLIEILEERRDVEGSGVKGEIVLVIDGPCDEERKEGEMAATQDAEKLIRTLITSGVRAKDAAAQVSKQCGISRNVAYEMALSCKESVE